MRRLLTACTALLALFVVSTVAHAAEPSELDRTVDGIEAFYKKVTAFRASFSQVVKRAHLPRPLKRSGKVYFKAPGKMRWDYTQPDKVYYVSDGDVLWSYEVETKQCIKMGVKQSELYDSLKFLFGQGDLRGSFEISAAPAKDGLTGVKLVPKTGQSNYKSLTLYADPKTFEIGRSELVDPLDNVSTITFEKVSYEDITDDKVFAFTPPKGVTVQDLTKSSPDAPAPPGGGE
ncbi:MAG: outer membrane lipoprotein chaperone LolA [Myxococcales bacterium]|nr:outer membrane lipoprotein chaperone LolA [Myxococcales bacterium]MCB9732219.1 outer membrane lipoprotein chaperone LolA [Deltaproteobacteria bacterium]